jgi:Gpi18-like mannosyltransferase
LDVQRRSLIDAPPGVSTAQNKWVGIGLAALAVALVGILLLWSKPTLTPTVVLHMSLVCVLAIPFLLPEMHERYFYLADVVSVIYAFYIPRSFYMPIIMQLASLLSYAPYLLNSAPISLSYVAVAILGILLIASAKLVTAVRHNKVGRTETAVGYSAPIR